MITPADSAPQAPGQMPASGFDIQAPYAAGSPGHILTGGDDDPGGRDSTAGDAAGAVAAAMARREELASDTHGQGSTIGDVMTLPAQDFSVATAHATGYGGQQ
jgi:hypothetical protein